MQAIIALRLQPYPPTRRITRPSSTYCVDFPSCLHVLLDLIQSVPTYQIGLYAILRTDDHLVQIAPDKVNSEERTECLSLSMALSSGMHTTITH
jgi:hypothetical protein